MKLKLIWLNLINNQVKLGDEDPKFFIIILFLFYHNILCYLFWCLFLPNQSSSYWNFLSLLDYELVWANNF